MAKTKKFLFSFLISLLIFLTLLLPFVSFAVELVPCSNSDTQPCDFYAFLKLINNVIYFILFYMAIPIAAIMFVYAGFLLVTAGGEVASARTKAKNIFTNALIGLVLAAACWLIVRTILSILGYDGAWIGF